MTTNYRIDLLIGSDRFEGAKTFKSRDAAENWIRKHQKGALRYELVEIRVVAPSRPKTLCEVFEEAA